jgi:hypothetical protein
MARKVVVSCRNDRLGVTESYTFTSKDAAMRQAREAANRTGNVARVSLVGSVWGSEDVRPEGN